MPQAAALAGVAVLALAGCGTGHSLAPGPVGVSVRPACAGPAIPLGADQLRAAYNAPDPQAGAFTGTGTVIAVIIPSTAAPHVAADLAVYSRRYRLPTPQVRVLSYGQAGSSSDAGWEREGTLDLEMAHVLAPQARLVYLAVPASAAGDGGRVIYDAALAWLVTRYHITVVSYSEGTPEAWAAPGYGLITGSRAGLEAAARAGVTVVASAGDYGPAEPSLDGKLQPTVAWPASDPLVTAVGGTRLTPITTSGRSIGYASGVFAFALTPPEGLAGGAGLSAVFSRPAWQDRVAAVTGSRRGVADISMDASPCSQVAAFTSTRHHGWTSMSGTSVAAPLFAGAVADAAQAAGHPLGALGPALYRMHDVGDGIADITGGTDAMPGIPGYPARPGYDLPTGIGTISSIPLFALALARLAGNRP